MADEQEPPTKSPLEVRARMPFEASDAAKHPGFRAAAFVYAGAAAIMAGVGAYMALVLGHPMLSVPVIAPAVGAIYFFVRFVMMLRPKL